MLKFLLFGVLFKLLWSTFTFLFSVAHSVVTGVYRAHRELFEHLFLYEIGTARDRPTKRG